MKTHSFVLPERTIQVWFADLTRLETRLEEMRRLLTEEEEARADRFATGRLRARFILRRGLLRLLLGRYTGRSPAGLAFTYGEHGKPALPGGPAFNLADSEDSVAIAIAAGGELGMDIERLRVIPDAEPMAERFFAPAEAAALKALPPDRRNEAFLLGWTRKEAVIKAVGTGLSLPLDRFAVELVPDRPARLLSVEETLRPVAGIPEDWTMEDLRGLPGTVAAVAMKSPGWRVESVTVEDMPVSASA